jgi:uncharacterized coiled-coil protein SlyX
MVHNTEMCILILLTCLAGIWERGITEKDETIETLNEVLANMTMQKQHMSSDVAALSKRCVLYKTHLRNTQATLNRQNERLAALYQMSQAMAMSLFQPQVSIPAILLSS